ncbi:MAG TPA: universal stress protein [Acidobacteriaceae bacterium]|nr:universal stress protein [Acidobacteriaceae bacterium]
MPIAATDTMPSFDRLLVATDFSAASQAACHTAIDTCIALRASLVILHVFQPVKSSSPDTDEHEAGGRVREAQAHYDACLGSLQAICRQAMQAGVDCEAILGNGNTTSTILDTIAAKKINLAIMGTSALHGLERIVFDSTTEAVLRQAPCPVLTVGPRAMNPERALQSEEPVIFATDFHFITIQAIRFAACFSQLTASPLHCLHVMPRTLEACTQCQVVPDIMSEALQQLANESGVVVETPICATTYGSEVSYAVVEYARQQKAKLIVLGVRKASLADSHAPLHIAYRIITEAPCPVLTMAFASQPDVTVETATRKVPATI